MCTLSSIEARYSYTPPLEHTSPLLPYYRTLFRRAKGLAVIPAPTDQNPLAQDLWPIDLILQGWSMSSFQASQQWATISS
jgi:hypothetical protein